MGSIKKVEGTKLVDSEPIMNNQNLLQLMVYLQNYAFRNNKKMLTQNLITELSEVFGPPNKTLRLEFVTKLWILEYSGLVFNVFSSNRKGTSIEVCGYSHDDIRTGMGEKTIIQFLNELYRTINSTNQVTTSI